MGMGKRDWMPVPVLAALCVAMMFAPTAERVVSDGGETVRARVVSVDDSKLVYTGLVRYGTQYLEAEIVSGPAAGTKVRAENELRAQMDLDKVFAPGDVALLAVPAGGVREGDVLLARDHWRLGLEAAVFLVFAALLVAFAGWTGLKALFSFVFSCVAVWKLLVPLCLNGWSALWTSFLVVAALTAVIMYLVAGATRKGAAAFLGATTGVAASLALARLFASLMHVNGATMPFSQALVYTGYPGLDLADIFCGGAVLAASGAVMDLAMDISAGVSEVARHSPGIGRRELFMSGVRIGRAVVGTMTTTLLLAYSGGYLTLLMVFAAQGTSPVDFINSTIVSAEFVKTMVGSFGLVLVAPASALAAAYLHDNG